MRGHDPVDPALRGGNRVGMAGSSKTGALAAWVSANRWISILLTVAAAMMVFAIVAPWIAPGDPTEVVLSERYLPLWSDGHALGTDHLGRDYHSRLIVGGRLSIMAGLIPAFGAMVAGLVIGMTSGYFGGWVDSVLMRIIDVLLAFPFLLLVILMVAVLGTDIRNAMIALMIGGTPERPGPCAAWCFRSNSARLSRPRRYRGLAAGGSSGMRFSRTCCRWPWRS